MLIQPCILVHLALLQMKAGDRVRIEQSGGGGWGDARLRDPEAVLRDVDDGIVSLESARRDYGVVAQRNANGELVVAALERGRTQECELGEC